MTEHRTNDHSPEAQALQFAMSAGPNIFPQPAAAAPNTLPTSNQATNETHMAGYDPDFVESLRTAIRTEHKGGNARNVEIGRQIRRLLPPLDSNEPAHLRNENERRRRELITLLSASDKKFDKLSQRGDIVPVQSELDELSAIDNGRVGRLDQMGWDISELGMFYNHYQAEVVRGEDADPEPLEELLNDKASLLHHGSDADRTAYIQEMKNELESYCELDDSQRLEIDAALAEYQNLIKDSAEQNEGLFSRLRAKAMGGVALAAGVSGISGLVAARLHDGFHIDRMQVSATLRKGFANGANGVRTGAASVRERWNDRGNKNTNENQPNILRRAHDWVMVETGIRMNDAMDAMRRNKEQRLHETDEEYTERMRKTGKKTRNVVLGLVALYGVSRVAPELSGMFHGGGANTLAGHTDTINDVIGNKPAAKPNAIPTEIAGGHGGGKPHFEDQDYSSIAPEKKAPTSSDIFTQHNPNDPTDNISVVKPPVKPPVGQVNAADMYVGHGSSTQFKDGALKDLEGSINGYKVKSGDTVWNDLVKDYLKEKGIKNPSVFQIDAAKDKLLPDLRAQGFVDSRGFLTKGATIKLK